MTPEQEKKIDNLLSEVSGIKIFLVGDRDLGTTGLKQDFEKHKNQTDSLLDEIKKEHGELKSKVLGVSAFLGLVLGAVGTFLAKIFFPHQ